MDWTRSETLALALHACTSCRGLGLRIGKRGGINPCNCVLRNIFRACFNRFRHCQEKEKRLTRAVLEMVSGKENRMTWGRKEEEYCADFLLVTKRTLTPEEHKIFTFYHLLGADWKLCCRRLNLDRGLFFHAVYRIEQKMGKTFRELQPYALYPLDDYFHKSAMDVTPIAIPRPANTEDQRRPIVVPIRPSVVNRPILDQEALPIPIAA